ncbi:MULTISPECIES: siderophore-interacting protein [unclassified Aeromicrobium]|uniref:siderophore-interacting protein n=1 Tax=unclassified Aeromicrobium TaxID=2633570 RepID=UPI00396B1E5C
MTETVEGPRSYWPEFDIKIRQLSVLGRAYVTPRMVRVTLGGPQLDGFESHVPHEHVKLVFPDPDTGVTRYPTQDGDHLDWPRPFPPTRDYTIRRYDAAAREIDIDFVVHAGGLASEWAQNAPVGSTIWVAGPRPDLVVPPEFGFHVLLGDETALPAIARWIEELPPGTRGVAAVEIHGDAERQDVKVPEGVSLHWLSRQGAPAGSTSLLGDFAEAIELPEGEHVYVFAQGEAGCIKPVRRWARAHGFVKHDSDIGGYWRRGKDSGVPTALSARIVGEAKHRLDHLLRREHTH